jgi:hypothetical protein
MQLARLSSESQLAAEYYAVLREFVGGSSEVALQRAYELGRRALDAGFGVLEVGRIHHAALQRIAGTGPMPPSCVATIAAAESCFSRPLRRSR